MGVIIGNKRSFPNEDVNNVVKFIYEVFFGIYMYKCIKPYIYHYTLELGHFLSLLALSFHENKVKLKNSYFYADERVFFHWTYDMTRSKSEISF